MIHANDLITDIKDQVKILDLAKQAGLQLKKQSKKTYKALCCFHPERKPSLTFYPETNTFRCYGCGEYGDAINFYAKIYGLSNRDAIESLATKLGLDFRKYGRSRKPGKVKEYSLKALTDQILAPKPSRVKTARDPIPGGATEIYEALRDFCGDPDEETLTYLRGKTRGLTDETIRKFKIFSIKDYKEARDFLLKRFSRERLEALSLLGYRKPFLFIWNKVIVPVIEDGKIIALRGRYLQNGNPVETEHRQRYHSTGFIRGRLFNGDILKKILPGERVYLCEGEFDTMILDQNGKKAVGLLGVSNYEDETIKRLNGYDLRLALDNDPDGQGRKQAEKIAGIFKKQTGQVPKLEKLPDGVKDITELFIKRKKGI